MCLPNSLRIPDEWLPFTYAVLECALVFCLLTALAIYAKRTGRKP